MTPKKLAGIKRNIVDCRRGAGNLRHRDLASIAIALGRRRSKQRTTEPTYESSVFDTNVITIPDHSKGLKKWTALSILNQLEEDVYRWEEKLRREQRENRTGNGYVNGEDEYDED